MNKRFEVKYSIHFETHGYREYGEYTVDDDDQVYDEKSDSYHNVTCIEDAEKFVEDLYHNLPEDKLVDIPYWIWDSEHGVGDTCFDLEETRAIWQIKQ